MALVCCLAVFTGCGAKEEQEEKIEIITTTFPVYDWVNEIVGEENPSVNVHLLADGGTDLHNYQMTAKDRLELEACDLFVYVGGESEEWVEEILENGLEEKGLSLMELLKEERLMEEEVAGMEIDHEEGDHEEEYDEHVWLSLKNAKKAVQGIGERIIELDPEQKALYEERISQYEERLQKLDQEFEKAVEEGQKDTLLFGDRFPFLYMTKDYGLQYYAAFNGCSSETEASFETIIFLAQKTDQLGLHYILTIDGSDQKIAETILENTTEKNQQILTMDSMQSVTLETGESYKSYLTRMEENLEVLKQCLKE